MSSSFVCSPRLEQEERYRPTLFRVEGAMRELDLRLGARTGGATALPATVETSLGERFRRGETAVLVEIVRDLCPSICRGLRRKYKGLLAEDRAEQVALEALDHAWRHRGEYDPAKGPLGAWLWTIADHRAADFCASPQGQCQIFELALDPDRLARMCDPSARAPSARSEHPLRDELCDLVDRALEAMPAMYREVLLAFACAPNGDLSSAELAVELHVSDSAIRMRHRRGKALLEAELRRLRVEDLLFCDTQTVFTCEGTNGEPL